MLIQQIGIATLGLGGLAFSLRGAKVATLYNIATLADLAAALAGTGAKPHLVNRRAA